MPVDLTETIAAIASPAGGANRGIVRISGLKAIAAAAAVFQPEDSATVLEQLTRPTRVPGHVLFVGEQRLPAALMVWPSARSYTGQPMVEFHTDSCLPLLNLLQECLFQEGVRAANRGEFTMRAFLAGRIDLLQAEAVVGVIDAADHEELAQALSQLGGGITSELNIVRDHVLQLLGDLEAGLDFVEEDIEFITVEQITDRLGDCLAIVERIQNSSQQRLSDHYRPRVVLAGLPNAGKSTLFNAIVADAEAIVSEVAGTTRDYLLGPLIDDELQVDIVDTAGLESAEDAIGLAAQVHRLQQASDASLVVWCTAADLSEADKTQDEAARAELADHVSADVLPVVTRCDLVQNHVGGSKLFCSAFTRKGLPEFHAALRQFFSRDRSSKGDLLAATAARCRGSLVRTFEALSNARTTAEERMGDEVVAIELRDALQQLGEILGEVYTDDILDHIFSNFCIGK